MLFVPHLLPTLHHYIYNISILERMSVNMVQIACEVLQYMIFIINFNSPHENSKVL